MAKQHKTELYLIRHAETPQNNKDIIQGHQDTELSESGKYHAYMTRKKNDLNFDAWYSSDLKRAMCTANILNKESNTTESSQIRERDFGEIEGNNSSVIDEENLDSLNPEGGESWEEVYERTREYLEDLARTHCGETVAVVSHKGPIQSIIGRLEEDHNRANDFGAEIDNLSYSILEYDESELFLKEYNQKF